MKGRGPSGHHQQQRPKPPSDDESPLVYVEGMAALNEYAQQKPKWIKCVFGKPGGGDREGRQLADRLCVPFKLVTATSREEAGGYLPAVANVWAEVHHQAWGEADFFQHIGKKPREERILVLVLDHITDPRNLGAIVRSASFFGIAYVIAAKDRQVGITQGAVNTAQGGFAWTHLVQVANVPRVLETLKESGFWVAGADMKGEPLIRVAGKYERCAYVLGSEDKGISDLVRKRCDLIVSIPGGGALESLNVSVAASILMYAEIQAKLLT